MARPSFPSIPPHSSTWPENTEQCDAAEGKTALSAPALRALANISIELRAPLSVILGHAENVLQTADDDTLRSVAAIEKSGKRIARIASDILALEALEHEIAESRKAPSSPTFQLNECLTDVRGKLNCLLRERRTALDIRLSPADCRVSGDYYFWFLAFQHLIENAVDDNAPELTLTISVWQKAKRTIIEVVDAGIGIPPDDLAHIFSPFHRVKRFRENTTIRGVGLGLYYVRRVVTHYGGEISVSSIPGRTTSFKIDIATPGCE